MTIAKHPIPRKPVPPRRHPERDPPDTRAQHGSPSLIQPGSAKHTIEQSAIRDHTRVALKRAVPDANVPAPALAVKGFDTMRDWPSGLRLPPHWQHDDGRPLEKRRDLESSPAPSSSLPISAAAATFSSGSPLHRPGRRDSGMGTPPKISLLSRGNVSLQTTSAHNLSNPGYISTTVRPPDPDPLTSGFRDISTTSSPFMTTSQGIQTLPLPEASVSHNRKPSPPTSTSHQTSHTTHDTQSTENSDWTSLEPAEPEWLIASRGHSVNVIFSDRRESRSSLHGRLGRRLSQAICGTFDICKSIYRRVHYELWHDFNGGLPRPSGSDVID